MTDRSESARQYYQENKTYLKMKSLENYYKNRYKYADYNKEYYRKNKDKIREQRGRVKRAEKKEKIARLKKPQGSPLVKEVKKIVLKELGKPFEFPESSFSVSFL